MILTSSGRNVNCCLLLHCLSPPALHPIFSYCFPSPSLHLQHQSHNQLAGNSYFSSFPGYVTGQKNVIFFYLTSLHIFLLPFILLTSLDLFSFLLCFPYFSLLLWRCFHSLPLSLAAILFPFNFHNFHLPCFAFPPLHQHFSLFNILAFFSFYPSYSHSSYLHIIHTYIFFFFYYFHLLSCFHLHSSLTFSSFLTSLSFPSWFLVHSSS